MMQPGLLGGGEQSPPVLIGTEGMGVASGTLDAMDSKELKRSIVFVQFKKRCVWL